MRKITDEFSDFAKFQMSLKGYSFSLRGSRVYTFELYQRGFRDSYSLIHNKTSYLASRREGVVESNY